MGSLYLEGIKKEASKSEIYSTLRSFK